MAKKKKQGLKENKDKMIKYIILESAHGITPHDRRINVQS